MADDLCIFSGNSNRELSEKIAKNLDTCLCPALVSRFSDSEIRVKIEANVRGKDVFVVQATSAPVNEHLMELLIMIDALRRASAKRITAVIPYFGYARQDRKDQPRVPITARLVANLITVAGANRVLTMDLHAGQIQGFFDIPLDNLYGINAFLDYFAEKKALHKDLVVVSPDVGGIKMARGYARRFNAGLAIIDKRRISPHATEAAHILGEVEHKDAIMVDDIVATGSSLIEGANVLKKAGCRKIYAAITHGVLSADAISKIQNSAIDELIITDSIYLPEEKRVSKIKVITVASILAEAIKRIHSEESISILFDFVQQ